MTTYIAIILVLIVALLAVFRLGRNAVEKDDLKRNVATEEKANETLQKQRDGRIISVDDADRLFDSLKDN